MNYDEILAKSISLSKPYWDLYEQLIRSRPTTTEGIDDASDEQTSEIVVGSSRDSECSQINELGLNPEYLKLIKITREHQAKRQRQKRLRQKQGLGVEIYYKDISQVDTLVEDNLVEVPDRKSNTVGSKEKEQQLIEIYGGREAYESVRTIEMTIDELFHKKCQELRPGYWPVMPLKHKRYLNNIVR